MMVPLRMGAKRAAVALLQRGYNERAENRPSWPKIVQDGELGPETFSAVLDACYKLGALGVTLSAARRTRTISVGMQRMVRWPDKRSRSQLARARARARVLDAGPHRALEWARQYIGKTEQPPGSNKAPWGLTDWQLALGSWLVGQAWCGTFVGTALIRAGVKGVNSRVAGVILILDDALNGRNGMRSCLFRRRTGAGSVGAGRPGDLLGLFGESTHVGMVEKRVPGGYQTIEGNTSSGNSGSQSNGGQVARRFRPDSAVVYVVRPDWS